ncbi:MAG: hypothetical protein ACI8VW_002601 [bacterium]|jgi:hypothetical protein
MFKKIAFIGCMSIAIGACSSSGSSETPGGPDTGGDTPSGTTAGVWFGATGFGEGVVIVGDTGQVTGLSSNGAGQYEAVFGNAGSAMERFFHRDSVNPASATSFTLAGDLPSSTDPVQADTQTYNLVVTNDGQQLDNTGDAGAFSLTFATGDDIGTIDFASISGTWVGLTSFCDTECDLSLTVNFSANGSFTGATQRNTEPGIPLTGSLTNPGTSQYLDVSMIWNGQPRNGVLYRDRTTARLVLNTVGPNGEDGNNSFSAFLTQQ